jgi:hypothetical protein
VEPPDDFTAASSRAARLGGGLLGGARDLFGRSLDAVAAAVDAQLRDCAPGCVLFSLVFSREACERARARAAAG